MNVWTFSGRCGADAELRTTQSGEKVLVFRVANEIGPKANRITQWVDCSYWGKRGEAVSDYIRKGDKITVSGEVKLEEFQRRDGSPGSKLAVRVNDVDLAPGTTRDTSDEYNQEPPARKAKPAGKAPTHADLDDEIPW